MVILPKWLCTDHSILPPLPACVWLIFFHNKKDGENQLELSPSLCTWSPALPRNTQQQRHKHKIYIVQPSCNPDHLYLLATSQMDNTSTTTWLLKPAVRARWWMTLWLVYDTFRMRGSEPWSIDHLDFWIMRWVLLVVLIGFRLFFAVYLSYFMGRIGYAIVLATSCRWKIYNG